MKSTPLPHRRLLAAATGLVVGLGGALAIASSSAYAQEPAGSDLPEPIVWCKYTLEVQPSQGADDPRPWRILLNAHSGDDDVLWQSGEWEDGELATTDPGEWEASGWTVSPPFTAPIELTGQPTGTVDVEYWDEASAEWKFYDQHSHWNGYDNPCRWVGEIQVVQPTCDEPGTITIPGKDPGDKEDRWLRYWVNGHEEPIGEPYVAEPGEYEVFGYRGGGEKTYGKLWQGIVIEPPDCPSPTPTPTPTEENGEGGGEELPVTGFQASAAIGGAALLLTLGAGLFLAARRRRITFTA